MIRLKFGRKGRRCLHPNRRSGKEKGGTEDASFTFYAFRFMFHAALLICLLTFLISCSQESEKRAPISWNVTFFPLGAKIHFDPTVREPVQQIRVFDTDGRSVAQLDLGGYLRRMELLYFRWEKGGMYRFEVTCTNGELTTRVAQAPQIHPRGSIEIAIPYGAVQADRPIGVVGTGFNPAPTASVDSAADSSQKASLVPQGSEMTATVLIRNGLAAPVTFHVVLQIPPSIQVLCPPPIWDRNDDLTPRLPSSATRESKYLQGKGEKDGAEETTLVAWGKSAVESEVWYSQLNLKIPDEQLPASTQISATVFFKDAPGDRWERKVTVPLRSATIDEIAGRLSIADVIMPADAKGVSDPRQRPDAISYPRPLLGGLGRWFGAKEGHVNEFQPVTYQTVHIHNRGQETVHVIVASLNRDLKREEPVSFLAPPDAINAGTNRSLAFVSLTGESATAVPLPIYFNPASVHTAQLDFIGAGRYERAIEVKIWGSDATVLHAARPLLIMTPNLHALLVTCLVLVATSLGGGLLLRFHQRLFSHLSTKQLIIISLFGATIFIVVSVPSTLLANLISALLGPIAFLITGLINEMLYYALLTSLLMLIPKSGAITLVSAVRLLLGSIMLGLFTPAALLYTGTSVLLLEAGFQISRRGTNLLLLPFIFGICDALAVYVDFQLSMTLYRLFYADWYILTRIFVDGFTYTFIGVLLGRRLGWGLWRVAD